MSEFVLQRSGLVIDSWDLVTGTQRAEAVGTVISERIMLSETDRISFALREVDLDREYTVYIGDVPLSEMLPNPIDARGIPIQGQLIWRDFTYFDSARGVTAVRIMWRHVLPVQSKWQSLIEIEVYVLPTKMGETLYGRMESDLSVLSRSLLSDLYGKSRHTYDVLFARELQVNLSKEEELDAIWSLVCSIRPLLIQLARQPASRLVNQNTNRPFWGGERIGHRGMLALSRNNIDIKKSPRPFNILQSKLSESFDIIEHRALVGFFDILFSRINLCVKAAKNHMESIRAEKHFRSITFGHRQSLYETVDVPKLLRLKEGVRKADESLRAVSAFRTLPFLRNVPADRSALQSMNIQSGTMYKRLWTVVQRYLKGGGISYPGLTHQTITKLTTRLFEQWCFLKIVDAFRSSGLGLQEWDDSIRAHLRSRFVVDFDRGLRFAGTLSNGMRLHVHFEPWILCENDAKRSGNTMCRISTSNVAWSPDIVIECLVASGGSWEPVYVIVMDCKYTSSVNDYHWQGVMKYLSIRSTTTRRQIAKQLWLISLNSPSGISSEDPAVEFSETGPSVDPEDTVQLMLGVDPLQGKAGEGLNDVFDYFARGTLEFLMRVESRGHN